MNRRKKKKLQKKREVFLSLFCNSYREVKQFDRSFHQWVVETDRYKRYKTLHGIKDEFDELFGF